MKNIFKNIVLFVGVFAFSFEANGASEYPEGYDVVTGLSGSVSVSGTISNKAYIDNNISNSILYFDGSTEFNAQNVYFANNINSGDWGGALFYASSHEAALENAVFIGNKIRFGGGAINLGGNITLKGTNRFDNNEVMETSDSVVTGGGAIRVAYGTITFGDGTNSSESVFSGNKVKVDDSSYGYNDIFMIGYGGIDDNTYGNNIVVKNNAKIVLDGGIAEMTIGASNTTVEEGGSIEFNNSGSGYTSYIGNILNNAGTVKGGANELEFSNTVTNSGTIYGSSANATNFVGSVTNTGTIVNTQGSMHFDDYLSSSGGSVDNRGTITFEKDIALGGANNYNSGTIIVGDDNIDGAEIGGNGYSEFLKLNNDTVINGNGSIVIKQDGRFKAFKEDATGNYNYVVHNSIDNEGNIVVDTGATLTATNGLVHNSLTANQWLINHGTLNATNAKIYGYTKNNGILSLFGNENVIERDLTGENIGTINVEDGAILSQKGDVSGSETSVGNYNIKNGGTVNIDGDVSIYNVVSNAGNISINENDVLRLYQGSSSGEIANSGQFIIEANPNYVPNPNYGEVDGGNESVDESGRTSFDLLDSAKVSGVGSLLVNNNASLKANGSNIVVENEIYNKGTIDVAQGSEFTATGGLYHYLESGSGEWFRNAGVANLTNFHAYGNITNSLTNQATDGNYINGIMNLYGTDNVFSAKIGNNANTVGENVGQAQINIMDEAVLTLINEVDFDYDEDGKIVGEGAITGGGVVNIKEGGTLTIGIKNHDTNGDGIIEKDEDNVANVKIFHNINNEGTILVGNGNENEKENLTLGKSFIQGAKGLIKTLLGGKITFIDIFENNGISSETADNGIQNQGEMQFNKELINKGSIDNSGNLIAKSTITNSGDIDNSGVMEDVSIIENSGTVSNSGTMEVATLDNQSSGRIDNTAGTMTVGTLTNSGDVNNEATMTVGTLDNSGNVTNSSIFTVNGTTTNRGTVSNNGTMSVATLDNSGMVTNLSSNGSLLEAYSIYNFGSFQNVRNSDKVGEVRATTFYNYNSLSNTSFVNVGTLENSGTVSNSDTIEVATLDNQSSGRIDNTAGTMTVTGTLTNSGAVSNSGIMEVATLDNSGTINGSGSLSITGGTTSTSEGSIEQGTLSIANVSTLNNTGSVTVGTLNNSGNVTNSNAFTVNGTTTNSGTVSNSENGEVSFVGKVVNNVSSFITNLGEMIFAEVDNSGTVSNSGTMEVVTLDNQSSGKIDNTAGSVTVGTLNNSGSVTNSSIFTVNDTTTNSGTVSNNGTMSVATLENQSGGTVSNNGTMSVATLDNSGTINGSGSLSITGGTTSTSNGSIDQGTLHMANGSMLKLGSSAGLTLGLLTNDSSGGTIDSSNNVINTYNVSKLGLNSALNFAIDMNLSEGISDKIVLGDERGTGTINISSLSMSGADAFDTFKSQYANAEYGVNATESKEIVVLENYGAGVQLTVGAGLLSEYNKECKSEVRTGVINLTSNEILWNSNYGEYKYDRVTKELAEVLGGSIKFSVSISDENYALTKADNLNLINTYDVAEEKLFKFETSSDEYVSIADAGETKGKLKVEGYSSEGKTSTINGSGKNLFSIGNGAEVTLSTVKVTEANKVASVGSQGKLVLRNVNLESTNGAIENNAKQEADKVYGIILEETNTIASNVSGSGLTTVASGTTTTSGTFAQDELSVKTGATLNNTGSVTVATLDNSGNVTNSSIFTVNDTTTNSGTVSNNGTMSLSNLLNENTINNSSILVMKGNSVNNGNINNMLTLEIFDSMALNDNSKIDGTGNFTIKEGTNIFANNTEIANKVNNLGNIFINQAKVLNIANDLIMNNASSLNLGLASKLNISGNYNAIGTPVMSLAVQIVDNALNHGQVTIGGNVSGITNVLLQFANDNIDASLSQEVANAGLSSAFVVANNDTLGTASSFNLWRISGATSTTNEQLNNVGAIYDWKILHNVNGNENGNENGNVWYIGLEKTEQTPPEGGDDSGNTGGEGGNEGGETPGISGGYYAEIPAYVGVYSSLIEQHRSVTNSVLKGVTCSHHRLCRKSDDNRRRAWIDTIYERSNIDEIADIDAKISGTTIGLDLYRDYEKTFGLFGSYRDGSYSLSGAGRYYSNVGSKIEDKSWLLGSYYQYVKEGVEWLTTLFAGKHSLEINTKDGVLADTHAKEYGASFNVSKKYYDLENWSFIPNMELRYSYLSVDDLNDNAGKRAYFESLSYLESKFAIRAEYKPSNLTDTSSVYIEPSINYIHATGGKLDISNLKNVSTYGDELYGRLEMGGTYNFTSKLSIYGNSGYSKGDDYEEYDIMLGINYSF